MQKIRIKIKGYDSQVVDSATKQIIETTLRSGAKVIGPIPLPTTVKKFAIHKSPNIDAKSKEHYEMRVHKRIVDILDPNSKTIDYLTHLQLASGVGVEIK